MYGQPINPNYMQQYQPPGFQYQPAGLPGRIVANFSEITIKDIPTDGGWAYFAKADGSEVQARRWNENGAVIQATFKREETKPEPDTISERLSAIEARLEKVESTRAKRKEPEND